MGENEKAADDYGLPLRLGSLFDGEQQSEEAGVVGQTADLMVRVADGPERLAGQFEIVAMASFNNLDLKVTSVFGDCADEDGDIDLDDYAVFWACLTRVDGEIELGCGCADFDHDGDADLQDWSHFQLLFTGPQ